MVELIKLPYRHYGTSTSVDLKLNLQSNMLTSFDEYYGREIQLHPFIMGHINKYKLIENYGDKIYERIFLMSKDIAPDDIWWRGDEHLLYPIQCKIIDGANCAVGQSFKYTQGILSYLQDYQADMSLNLPVFSMIDATDPRTQMIIPSPEEYALSYNLSGIKSFSGPYDQWLKNDVNIAELYPNIRYADANGCGLISLAQHDIVTQGGFCVDNDPLEHDWATWELVCRLNEIVANDVLITATRMNPTDMISGSLIHVDLMCRYNLLYENDIQYKSLISHLSQLTNNMIQSRFKNLKWDKIEIRKLWSEEVIIDVYESVDPSVISQVLYFDLPIFSLGTLGIQTRRVSYLHN